MFPARLFMGIVFFVMCGWMIGGIAEGQTQLITSAQGGDIMALQSKNTTSTVDTNSASTITFIDKTLTWIDTYILYDWSVFYDVYTGYTSGTCAIAGGEWQAASATCKIPNTFMILRWILMGVLGGTFVITMLLLFRRLTLG